ncbi:protein PHOTOSYSTEM I ASSEMBLY 2, chloroplastic isoform X1 [Senna tora]|uniref:Protein PHOTOSYSTEM I ASSEMBLY 2, chloroplastic isoform X1 n=1 Tax=Senna tora TaxID=362788 RepID=A0A834X120_9FABA|nr:protein PHOTOSYSTEM I ASSEMBLY 2, chloroplastic isoform X1 [Senna tora]
MANISFCCNTLPPPPLSQSIPQRSQRYTLITASAAKSGGFSFNSILKRCETCGGQGAIECPGCKTAFIQQVKNSLPAVE